MTQYIRKQLFRLTLGNLLINLPALAMAQPLQKVNHTDKCLWYFHPSYGSDNREITAESRKVLSSKLEALKSQTLIEN